MSPRPPPAWTATTGPSVGINRESACGPMSQSAPYSSRQGDASNGEPARLPSHEPWPPASRVRPACSSQVAVPGWKRNVKKTTDATPFACTAATTRSASARSSAMGFSSSRCLPASAALIAISTWTGGGSAIETASTSASRASRSP